MKKKSNSKNNGSYGYPLKDIILPYIASFLLLSLLVYCSYTPGNSYEKVTFGEYSYSYTLPEENELTVLFSEKRLPNDNKLLLAINQDAIKRVFNEDILEPASLGKKTQLADDYYEIRLKSSQSVFIINIIYINDEIQSLRIKRETTIR